MRRGIISILAKVEKINGTIHLVMLRSVVIRPLRQNAFRFWREGCINVWGSITMLQRPRLVTISEKKLIQLTVWLRQWKLIPFSFNSPNDKPPSGPVIRREEGVIWWAKIFSSVLLSLFLKQFRQYQYGCLVSIQTKRHMLLNRINNHYMSMNASCCGIYTECCWCGFMLISTCSFRWLMSISMYKNCITDEASDL